MTTTNTKKEQARVLETLSIYGLNEKNFACKPFQFDGKTRIESLAFVCMVLEQGTLEKTDSEIDDEGYTFVINEIKSNIKCLEGIVNNSLPSVYDIRKWLVTMPFITGVSYKVKVSDIISDTIKNDLKVLSAKLTRRVSEYIELQNDVAKCKTAEDYKANADKQKDVYVSAKNIAQNFTSILIGDGVLNIKKEDIQHLINSGTTLATKKHKDGIKTLEYTPENIGKLQSKMIAIIGNSLAGKTVKVNSSNAGADKALEQEEKRIKREIERTIEERTINELQSQMALAIESNDNDKMLKLAKEITKISMKKIK